jgi:hypothetical protein
MRIDLITKDLVGKLFSEEISTDVVYLKQMPLLDFIKNYKYVFEEVSYYDNDKGIVRFYRFKAREEKLFLEVSHQDMPDGVFNE